MYFKSRLVFLLILLSTTVPAEVASLSNKKDDGNYRFRREAAKDYNPGKPLFPNLLLPPEEKTLVESTLSAGHAHPRGSPCPNLTDQYLNPPPPKQSYQPPPQLQSDPQFQQPEPSRTPPIPELFRKSTTTPEPSIFQNPQFNQRKPSPTPPIPELFRKSTSTTQPSIFQNVDFNQPGTSPTPQIPELFRKSTSTTQPSIFQNVDFNQAETSPTPPIPELFRKSTSTTQPSIFQNPEFNQPETSPTPQIPELFRKSTSTTQPSIFQNPEFYQPETSPTPQIPELFRKSTSTTQPSIFQNPELNQPETSPTPQIPELFRKSTSTTQPSIFQNVDFNQPETSPNLQIPELFRKSTSTTQPSIFQNVDFNQPETSPTPPIPELFRKSTSTTQPSIFQNPEFNQRKPSPTPQVRKPFRKSTTTQPSIFPKAPPTESATLKSAAAAPIPQRVKGTKPSYPTPTEASRITSARTQKPTPSHKRRNELFPGLRSPLPDKSGRNLDVQGLPEPNPIYAYPNYPQEVQENVGDEERFEQPQRPYLTPPSIRYKIAVVADLGKDAKAGNGIFKSFLKEGSIDVQKSRDDPLKYNVTINLNENTEPFTLQSKLNMDGEGFELSTLNIFNGKLYSCDDETGIIYELIQLPVEKKEASGRVPNVRSNNRFQNGRDAGAKSERNTTYVAQPWIILSNEGDNTGFRCEWATVKDDHLWVGSTGILVRKPGEENALDKTRQGVKKVSPGGTVVHLDWTKNYQKISESIGLRENKGFAVHEGVAWSDILQRWLFTPRRISQERYDQKVYHKRGGNTAIFVDDQFENFKTEHLGELVQTAGFTSIKFIPGTDDQLILALKAGFDTHTNELMSTLEVFDINGHEVTPEISIGKGIYAGVEFI